MLALIVYTVVYDIVNVMIRQALVFRHGGMPELEKLAANRGGWLIKAVFTTDHALFPSEHGRGQGQVRRIECSKVQFEMCVNPVFENEVHMRPE